MKKNTSAHAAAEPVLHPALQKRNHYAHSPLPKSMQKLAIIGAGVAGLAAAWALREEALGVTLFEKSRGVSGRAATRGKRGVRYDHGANYFKTESARLERLVQEALPTGDLADISGAVWTFDSEGRIEEGDPEHNEAPKWTYRTGISALGKLLADAAGAPLQLETRVECLKQTGDEWAVMSARGHAFGPFDAVLVTPPAPQAAALLESSAMEEQALQRTLAGALTAVSYRTQLTVVLAFEKKVERPGDFYALLNTDGAHDVAWLGFEEDKPGHVPPGQSVLVAQMAPDWSAPRFEAPLGALVPEAAAQAGPLLQADLSAPVWADKQGWRYALPGEAADAEALEQGAAAGLFFAGDALAGKGRVGSALETGLDAAEQICSRLGG